MSVPNYNMKNKKLNKTDWKEDKNLEKIRQNLANLSEMISDMISRNFIELADMRKELAEINHRLFLAATGKE